jgi:hypothetical protein
LNILVNGGQWQHNRQSTALDESKKLQPPNHDFPHCSTMPKTIDLTKKSPSHLNKQIANQPNPPQTHSTATRAVLLFGLGITLLIDARKNGID